jgi:tetratricopeptide (TPR) repeat protein
MLISACSGVKGTSSSAKGKKGDTVKDEVEAMALMDLFVDAQRDRMLGNFAESVTKLKKCLVLDPDNHAVMHDLALIYDAQDRSADAQEFAMKAANLNPDNIWYQTLLAEIFVSQGDLDKAEATYEKILKTHPDAFDYYYELATIRFRQGDYAKSIEALDKIEETIGQSDELLQQKQMLYMELGQTDKAKAEVQKMIDTFPLDPRYYSMMAEIYQREGNETKAQEYYEKILSIDPDNGMVQLSMYEQYKNNGEDDKAREAIVKAFDDKNIDIDTKIGILLNYYNLSEGNEKELEEAYALCQKLTEVYPEDAKAHAVQGDFFLRDERYEEARTSFRRALEIDPSKSLIWNQLLSLDSELQDYPMLKKDSDEAIELFPTMPFFYLLNGIALSQQDQHKEAIDILESGKELVIDDDATLLEFYSTLGEAYHHAGQFEDSDKAYDRALNIRPDNVYVLNNYSYYLSLRKDKLDKAETMAAKANELIPGMASFQDTYAWVLYQAEKYEQAKEWLEKAMANGGNSSGTIIEHYGDVLFQLGQKEEAIRQWEKAKDLGDSSDMIDKKIRDGMLYE